MHTRFGSWFAVARGELVVAFHGLRRGDADVDPDGHVRRLHVIGTFSQRDSGGDSLLVALGCAVRRHLWRLAQLVNQVGHSK